jgi:hypothetical protein
MGLGSLAGFAGSGSVTGRRGTRKALKPTRRFRNEPRIKITPADDMAARLDELAAAAGQPVARVAGQMVRDRVVNPAAAAHGSRRTPADEPTTTRAPWLEP